MFAIKLTDGSILDAQFNVWSSIPRTLMAKPSEQHCRVDFHVFRTKHAARIAVRSHIANDYGNDKAARDETRAWMRGFEIIAVR